VTTKDHTDVLIRIMIFILPTEILADILSRWVDWPSIARLDSAMCNKLMRFEFLDKLKGFIICNEIMGLSKCSNLHNWIWLRSIRASVIHVAGNFPVDPALVEKLMHLSRNDLRRFRWFDHNLPVQFSTCIVMHCSRLTSLILERCKIDDVVWDIIAANQLITELRLTGYCVTSTVSKLHNALCGTNITQLSMSGGDTLLDTTFLLMLEHMPNLRTLKATDFTNETLIQVSKFCPKIVHLHISDECNNVEMDDETFVAIISNLHNIRSIRVACERLLTEKSLIVLAALHSHSITYLELYLSDFFPVDGIATLINRCANLKTLFFPNYFAKINLPFILAAVESREIKHLHMHCGIDDRCMRTVLKNFPNLVTFGCWLNHYTTRSLLEQARNVATQCKNLRAFYTPAVWAKDPCVSFMEEFSRLVNTGKCPELDIFTFSV